MVNVTWAFGPPNRMKVPPACHSDPAGAGEESASYLLLAKADPSLRSGGHIQRVLGNLIGDTVA